MGISESLKPFHILRHDMGKSSFFFMADAFYNEPVMDLLAKKCGIEKDDFNGYAWKRIVESFVTQEFPAEIYKLQFDPEAEMFSMIAEDHALLINIARHFREFLQDDLRMKALFSKA